MNHVAYQFSVIVPTYNRPDQLAGCIASLARLRYPSPRFEVIIVDDGSTLALQQSIEPFRDRLNVSLLRTPNQGPAAARNSGAEIARGRFLAFTDDDCRPHPDWLSHIETRFQRMPRHMVGGRTVNQLDQNPYSTTSQVVVDMVYAFYNRNPDDARFFASNNIGVATDMFRTIGGFDTGFRTASEDREFCDRWRHAGLAIAYEPRALVYHAHSLGLVSFCKQHFNYGRGASRYHQVRARRRSGRMTSDIVFHARLPQLLRQPMSTLKLPRAVQVAILLAIWQLANAAGFFYETLVRIKDASMPGLGRHRHKDRAQMPS